MKIAEIDNNHKIFNTILWQYEKAPRLVKFVSALSDFGYRCCGELFDQIMNGLVDLYADTSKMAREMVQALTGSIGFNWDAFSDIEGAIECIMSTKFFGNGNTKEFIEIANVFGFSFYVNQLPDGGRVLIYGIAPQDVSLLSLYNEGISNPLSASQIYEDSYMTSFLFTDSDLYDEYETPRLSTEVELSYVETGNLPPLSNNWDIDSIVNGNIWNLQ